MGVTVDAPDGRTWHVSRHLHRPQWHASHDDRPWAGLPLLDFGATVRPPVDERTWGVRGFLYGGREVAEVADELRRGVVADPAEWEVVR
jgi:hypothetical protein